MLVYLQTNWDQVLKVYGPLGIFCGLAIIFVKVLLKYIKDQHAEHTKVLKDQHAEHARVLQDQAEDARRERDYSRQLRELEVNKFIESLKLRDEKMERGFDEVVRALRKE